MCSPWVLPIAVWHCLVFTIPLSILRQQLKTFILPILTWIFPSLSVTPCISPLAVFHQTHSSMCMLVLFTGPMHSPRSSRPSLLQEHLEDTCSNCLFLLAEISSSWSVPNLYCCMGLTSPRCRTWLDFVRLLSVHFCRLSWYLQVATLPSCGSQLLPLISCHLQTC